MHANSSSASVRKGSALLPIFVGGFLAGSLDLTAAFVLFGWGTPRAIASGLLGAKGLHGGLPMWILGVILHYFIALSASAVYYLSSRKLEFLKSHFVLCGVFYGIGVYLVMNLIVVPLSAVPFKTSNFTLSGLIQGLLVHIFCIGLPIAFSVSKFSE